MVHAVSLVLNLVASMYCSILWKLIWAFPCCLTMVKQKMQEGSIVRIDTDIPVPTRDIVLVQSSFGTLNLKGQRFTSLLIVKSTRDKVYNYRDTLFGNFRKCVFLYFRLVLSMPILYFINLLNCIIQS